MIAPLFLEQLLVMFVVTGVFVFRAGVAEEIPKFGFTPITSVFWEYTVL